MQFDSIMIDVVEGFYMPREYRSFFLHRVFGWFARLRPAKFFSRKYFVRCILNIVLGTRGQVQLGCNLPGMAQD